MNNMNMNMDRYPDLIIKNTKLPSYLLELLGTEQEIALIYCKKKIEKMSALCGTYDSLVSLTGSPLEVDLSEILIPNTKLEKYNVEEMEHFPIKHSIVRNFINDYNRCTNIPNKLSTVYGICDGSQDNIIILGCYQKNGIFARTLVFSPICVSELYPQSNISKMVQDHIKNCEPEKSKIDVEVKSLHELYGYKLSNDDLNENTEIIGSILVEGFWNVKKFHIPEVGATVNMMLQVIIGYERSIMHNFFKELNFLEQCLNEYSNNGTLEEFIGSNNYTNITLLQKKVCDILYEIHLARKSISIHNTLKDMMQNLIETSFTDKLWNVLKSCNKSSDIKSCLDTLFGSINNGSRIQIFEDDKTTKIGTIIENICMGKMIVSHLSSKQALGLLIELGLKKMKKKYLNIINCFNFQIAEQLLNKWNEIGSLFETGGFLELNISRGLFQLQLLQRMHILLEFLNLVEQQKHFSKDVSSSVLKHAYNKYRIVEYQGVISFDLKGLILHDLVLPLTSDIKLINSYTPIQWKLKLTSSMNNSSVVTIFHYSKKSIFPSVIYNHLDANKSGEEDEEKYFETRLEKYSDKFF